METEPILYQQNMYLCQICQKPFIKLGAHLRAAHHTTLNEYIRQYDDPEVAANTFTPEVAGQVVEGVRRGLRLPQAAMLARLNPQAVLHWMERGSGNETPALRRFAYDVQQAEAESISHHLGNIIAAGDTDYRASAWLLERRFGFIQTTRSEVTQSGETQVVLKWGDGSPVVEPEAVHPELTEGEFVESTPQSGSAESSTIPIPPNATN